MNNYSRIILMFLTLTSLQLIACTEASPNAQMCEQANRFIDRKLEDYPVTEAAWGRMMLAGARLLYVEEACGDRVTASKEVLCTDHYAEVTGFAANELVPRGENRSRAINQNRRLYADAGCQPALDVE